MNHPVQQYFTPTHRLNQPRINFVKKNRGSLREPETGKDLIEDNINPYNHQPVHTDPNADIRFSELNREIIQHHKPKAPIYRMVSIKNISNAPQLIKFFQIKQEISVEIPDKKESQEPSLNRLDNESPFSPLAKRVDSARKRTISLALASPKSKKDLHVTPIESPEIPPANMFSDEALFQNVHQKEKEPRRQTIKRIMVNELTPEPLPKLSPKYYDPQNDSSLIHLRRQKIQPWALLSEAAEKLESSNANFKAFYQPDISNLKLEKNKQTTKSQNSLTEQHILPALPKNSYRSDAEQVSSQITSPKTLSPQKETKNKKQGEAKSRDESPIKYWEGFEILSAKLKGLVRGGKTPKKVHVSSKSKVKLSPINHEIVEKIQKLQLSPDSKGHSKHSLHSLAEEEIMAHLQSLRKPGPAEVAKDTYISTQEPSILTILQTKALEPIVHVNNASSDARPHFNFEFKRPRISVKDNATKSRDSSQNPESLSNSPGKYEAAAGQEKAFVYPGQASLEDSPRKKLEKKRKGKVETAVPSQILEEPQSFLEKKLVNQAKDDELQGWHLDTSRDISRLKTPDNQQI